MIPFSAVIRMDDGDDVVFVETPDGFEPRVVVLGRRVAQIRSRCSPGSIRVSAMWPTAGSASRPSSARTPSATATGTEGADMLIDSFMVFFPAAS